MIRLLSIVACAFVPGLALASPSVLSVDGGRALNLTQSKELTAGAAVNPGDKITTEAGVTARILLDDDTVLQIGPQSEVEIQAAEQKNWSVTMSYGTLMAGVRKFAKKLAKPKLSVRVRDAVMGVRGTVLYVRAAKPEETKPTFLCVCMGLVELTGAGGKINKEIKAKNHDFPQSIDHVAGKSETLKGEFEAGHTDADMNAVKALLPAKK